MGLKEKILAPFQKPNLTSVIESEGFPIQGPYGPTVLQPQYFQDASEYLFGVLLMDPSDPRLTLAQAYHDTKERVRFKPQHFENALLAIYLSDKPSFRNRYSGFTSEENLRHLCRALHNLGSFHEIGEIFTESQNNEIGIEGIDMQLAVTHSVNLGCNAQGITGCPEALYQLQMQWDGHYIGRIGFNTHLENDKRIISVTNIQGIPSENLQAAGLSYENFHDSYGAGPHNMLLRRLKTFSTIDPSIELRGLRNPKHKESSAFYNTVFKNEGLKRMKFKRHTI
ncbi:MAG: hypothetical protein ACEQSA_01425 [Weeksellaceae bacterium]